MKHPQRRIPKTSSAERTTPSRTALENPVDLKARETVDEACKSLEHQIAINGKKYEHSFHVLGSQCLAWVRHGLDRFEEQRDFLEYAIEKVKEGTRNHPTSNRLKSLLKEMEDERMRPCSARTGKHRRRGDAPKTENGTAGELKSCEQLRSIFSRNTLAKKLAKPHFDQADFAAVLG